MNRKKSIRNIITLFPILALSLVLLLTTCEKVPDYCGKGAWYDPSCEFCFSQRAYPLCVGSEYNPLTEGCYRGSEVGALCIDGSVVPFGAPCAGYTLAVDVTPALSGVVTRDPEKQRYGAGETVVLSAVPSSAGGFAFVGWAGSSSSPSSTVTLTMDANKPMAAMFRPIDADGAKTRTLTVAAFPLNGGAVVRNPDSEGGVYGGGEAVTVTASAAFGYTFDGWAGSLTSASSSVAVVMDGSKTLVAKFKPDVYTLAANAVPSDGGAVYVNGTALSRPASWEFGSVIELLAVPAYGYVFVEWSGAAAGMGNPARISVTDGDMSVGAVFRRGGSPSDLVRRTYSVTVLIGSTGASVSGEYAAGETVTISVASPPPNQRFVNWTTDSPGVYLDDAERDTTTFIMPPNAVTVTANFE